MDKDKFLAGYREIDAKVMDETGRPVSSIVVHAGICMTLVLKAAKARKAGNYGKALYYLALWHSFKMSQDNAIVIHQIKKVRS